MRRPRRRGQNPRDNKRPRAFYNIQELGYLKTKIHQPSDEQKNKSPLTRITIVEQYSNTKIAAERKQQNFSGPGQPGDVQRPLHLPMSNKPRSREPDTRGSLGQLPYPPSISLNHALLPCSKSPTWRTKLHERVIAPWVLEVFSLTKSQPRVS